MILPCRPRRPSNFTLLILFTLCGAVCSAGADPPKRPFRILEGDAPVTLRQFSQQSGEQIVYPIDQVRGVKTNSVAGSFTPRDALRRMVANTDLIVVEDNLTGALTVGRRPRPPPDPPPPDPQPNTVKTRSSSIILTALLSLISPVADGRAAERGDAVLQGTVSSTDTRNHLEGALVEIPALNRQALTDANGRFVLEDLPAGVHEVSISYLGLETQRERVDVPETGRRALTVALKPAGIVQLQQFVVASEREGNALAVTSQRNAPNLKNAVALDALGNLPNTNPGELALRLPGVTGSLDSEGNVNAIQIRGTAANLNRLSIDGNQMSSGNVFDRQFQMHSLSGAMFEQLEIIKGHTPDQSADSIGGTVNLKTRSPLSLSEKRRFNYSVGARWAPPFFEAAEVRRRHPIHPQINLSYMERFNVRGGERNLGVALTAFYSENVNTHDQIAYDNQNTTSLPAYIWDYRESTRYSNRRQDAFNLKVEYRLSDTTKIFVNGLYNDGTERFNRIYDTRAFSNQTIATLDAAGRPTGNGAILPGFSPTFTQVRAVAGSNFQTTTSLFSYFNRTRLLGAGAEHKTGRWEVDYDANFGRTHNNVAHGMGGPGGQLIMRVNNVGWTLDTSDPSEPVFTQTEGPSIYDVANYRTGIQQTIRNTPNTSDVYNAKANVLYRLPFQIRSSVKGGLFFRHHEVGARSFSRRFNYIGTAPLPAGTVDPAQVEVRQRDLPFVDPATTFSDLSNSALWSEDLYYGASEPFAKNRRATEEITAGYVQARAQFGALGVLGGVRTERTEVEGSGYVRRRPATAAEIPDPAARANYDWNNPQSNDGGYTRSFPSIHLTYDLTRDLKARASWSTSFGRPSFLNMIPSAEINDTAQTVTVSNPSIGPQYSRNLDVSLEYYFSDTGFVSAGYFRKRISDYILTAEAGIVGAGNDNGFNGDYSGYTMLSTRNAGDGEISGWEFDYRQQFTFLPGPLKGLGGWANYTVLESSGNFGGTSVISTDRIAGFIPRTGNLGLTYTYGSFGARLLVNYTSGYLQNAAASDARLAYRFPRTIVNVGVSYQIRPELKLFFDVQNLTSEPQRRYRYIKALNATYIHNTPALTFGVSGQF